MKSKHIYSLINGFQKFLEHNTGLITNSENEHYVLNPDYVLSNNRHNILKTAMEGQPNGDATTEGQSLLILGWLHAYIGSNRKRKDWLENAIKAFNAYVKFFYASEIPETPKRWLSNWIINGKEPILANYPVDNITVTHSGFKGIEFDFIDGKTVIPSGSPYFGEYLDKVTFAFKGNLSYQSIIAGVRGTNSDGSTNWDTDGKVFEIDYIIDLYSRKLDGKGNIIDENSSEEKGTVQLKDHITDKLKLNFAPRVPVENGGYLIGRNEAQHNRPLHVPVVEKQLYGNSSDSEQWFCIACKMLYKETGDIKYYNAWKASEFTCVEYTELEKQDRFFRKEILSKTEIIESTPFTDGISYDYQWTPSGNVNVKYSRDTDGYICFKTDNRGQNVLEQKAINPKVGPNQKIHIEYSGMPEIPENSTTDSTSVLWQIELTISNSIENLKENESYTYELNPSYSNDIISVEIPLKLFKVIDDSILPSDINTWDDLVETYEDANVFGNTQRILKLEFPNEDAGCDIKLESEILSFIVYKANSDFDIYFYDDLGYRYYFLLKSNIDFEKYYFDFSKATPSYYQPKHRDVEYSDIPAPTVSHISEITIGIDEFNGPAYLCIAAINKDVKFLNTEGYVSTFSISAKNIDLPFSCRVGDCYIVDPIPSGNLGIPGVIPYSNITTYGTYVYYGWRGCPYTGYQYPAIYVDANSEDRTTLMNNMIDFMYSAQITYSEKFGILGPVMQTYIWNRWDCLDYGEKNTFTMLQFNDKGWSGYESRAYQAGTECLLELVRKNKDVPEKLIKYVTNWTKWLISYYKEYKQTPTDFPSDSVPVPLENDFTGHMTGLWLAGACQTKMAGLKIDGLDEFINGCVKELQDNYINTKIPNHVMNGSWSPAPRISTGTGPENNGMFFGFWAGEILRGLGLYLQLQNSII